MEHGAGKKEIAALGLQCTTQAIFPFSLLPAPCSMLLAPEVISAAL